MRYLNNLPPIEDLLPHRGTMLLLDHIVAFDNESTTTEYTPHNDAWYADAKGNMPAWIGIELMAQTVAAHVGLLKHREGASLKHGVLLGTRRFTSARPFFLAGEPLRIDVQMIFRDISGLGAYECQLSSCGKDVASATLKVFEPADFQSYLQTPSL